MGNYTIFSRSKILGEEDKQEILQQKFRKFLDLKSSFEQIFSENWHWMPLTSKLYAYNTSMASD